MRLYELEAWSFSWLNQTDGGATQAHAFQWALRVEKCYLAAARGVERRYDYFVRLRPDLLWEDALGAVHLSSSLGTCLSALLRCLVALEAYVAGGAPCSSRSHRASPLRAFLAAGSSRESVS